MCGGGDATTYTKSLIRRADCPSREIFLRISVTCGGSYPPHIQKYHSHAELTHV